MTKTLVAMLGCVLASCASRAPENRDRLDPMGSGPAGTHRSSESLVDDDASPTLPLPSPGTGAPPAPAPPPAPPAAPPLAPCQGADESEPNDTSPATIGPNTCGTIAAGDVDRLAFDVRAGNVFVLELDGDAALRMLVDGCIDDEIDETGPRVRVRAEPRRDCTIRVKLTSTNATPTRWALRRDK